MRGEGQDGRRGGTGREDECEGRDCKFTHSVVVVVNPSPSNKYWYAAIVNNSIRRHNPIHIFQLKL